MRSITVGITLLAGVCGAACGADPTCKETAEKAAKVLGATGADVEKMAGECERQAWSGELRRCVAGIGSKEDAVACMKHRVREVMTMFDESKQKIAKLAVDQFAFSAGPQWQVSTAKACPESLLVLATFVGRSQQDTIDPWGSPYKLLCGRDQLPPGAIGFAVMSFGPDQKEGTADDIRSWEPQQAKP